MDLWKTPQNFIIKIANVVIGDRMLFLNLQLLFLRSALGGGILIVGNGLDDPSSNSGKGYLCFTTY